MDNQNQQSVLLGKIAAYTEILVKDPRSTIFVSLAETYRKMGMFEDSRQIINKGLELHPDFSPAHIVLARVLCQIDDFEASSSAFQQALDLDPDSLAAFVGYARVKILLGQELEARDLLLRARELSPADPVINKLLLSLPPQESDSVQELVEAVAEEVPEINSAPLVSATLAELYLKQGLKDEALKAYQDLSLQSPDDLNLRRKIKELEGTTVAVEVDSATSQENDVVSPEADLNETVTSDSTPLESSDTPELELSSEDTIMATLNRWLVNIEQRRGHV